MLAPVQPHPASGFVEVEPLVIVGLDLVAVIVAALALLVVGGGWVLGWLIQELFGGIGVGPFHPFRFIGSRLQGAMAAIAQPLIKRMAAFGHAAWSLVQTIWRFVYLVTQTLGWVAGQLDGTNQQIRNAAAAEAAREQADIGMLAAAETRDVAALKAAEQADVAGLQQEINQDLAASIAYTQAQAADLNARITTVDSTLAAQLNAQVNTLNNRINQVNTGLTSRLNTDISTVNATISRDVSSLTAKDAADLATAENFATGLVSGLGVGALTSTVAALAGQVGKLATDTAECLDPLCQTVTPQAQRLGNLGKYLSLFESLAVDGLLVALAAECLTDPAAVAEDVTSVVNAVGQPIVVGVRDVIGG